MNKKVSRYLFLPGFLFLNACRLLSSNEFDSFTERSGLQGILNGKVIAFLNDTSLFFTLSPAIGGVIFILGLFLFFLHVRDKAYLYLGLSALLSGFLYSLPFWTGLVPLPPEFWSLAMVRTLALILYWQLYREWARKALYHRTKSWSYIANSVLLSAVLICTLLSGHFPSLSAAGWPVVLTGGLLYADSLGHSILSFRRKSDRSGIAGVLTTIPPLGCGIWLFLSSGYNGFLSFVYNLLFVLPAFMLVWQLILTLALTQRRHSRQIERGQILSTMIEEEEKQKDKLEQMIESLEVRNEENARIPEYSLECSRLLMGEQGYITLPMPESWEGNQRLSTQNSINWPVLGAWFHQGSLLFAENRGRESFTPLLFLAECFRTITGVKPALIPRTLNEKMISLSPSMEAGLSGCFIHFMEDEVLCGTAGTVRIYLQKGETVLPIRSDDKPVTFAGGFGVRAQTREDGKPFRLKMDRNDKLILVSVSLTDRELAATGDIYGQKALYRVLKNRVSASSEETVQAIVKDFEDFDMGNTEDRQIYAAVFKKL